jgi:hypothetical protein
MAHARWVVLGEGQRGLVFEERQRGLLVLEEGQRGLLVLEERQRGEFVACFLA